MTDRRPPQVSPYLPTVLLFGLSLYFFYDGWFNPAMIEHRTFNRVGAPLLLALAIFDGVRMHRRLRKRAAERAAASSAESPGA